MKSSPAEGRVINGSARGTEEVKISEPKLCNLKLHYFEGHLFTLTQCGGCDQSLGCSLLQCKI